MAIEKVVSPRSSLGTPGVGRRRYRGVAIVIGAWLLSRRYHLVVVWVLLGWGGDAIGAWLLL